MFAILARAKRLRGTPLDPFGRSAMRRVERAMVDEYEQAITAICEHLGSAPQPGQLHRAIELALLPDMVRGFEGLKMTRATEYRTRLGEALDQILCATS